MKPVGLPICLSENALPNEGAKDVGGGSNGSGENDSYLKSYTGWSIKKKTQRG